MADHEAGAKLVTLGPRILRTETAAIASQTIVMAPRRNGIRS
ncbi:MAG: 16S rRNA (uracil(1498)-N(3))-methyltransferase [Christensenellales bacterium]